ncbi:transcriptional regulator, BadM/Rrf2 family [Saccharicrinis carchari]|uniref:Transcriptional regulator, BadM/Rrf2 family n=1 Tax=Saccharicrinis carchari TaxID=1168039 RepID=A0A521ERX7_SACCC|nr:Rrf2 family transcriptional regulator [Saccharicrinis carchari]SMO86171.1 transcriptional regulator, BadM/Rrf2 family [Saccharicrinis carchari]
MKFSKKTEYGLRFLLSLSELGDDKFMGIYHISLRHAIPMKFLEAIAVLLKKAGLLEVKKGAGGGYKLKHSPEEISLLMVFECLEDTYKNELNVSGDMSNNQKAVTLVLNQTITDVKALLAQRTLADIQKEYKDLNASLMYYI